MAKMVLAFLLGAAAGAVATMLGHSPQDIVDDEVEERTDEEPDMDEDEPVNDAEAEQTDMPESQTCRAEILETCRDLDPVTLQGWSRVSFLCEDGETRKFTFAGVNGVHLVSGETGLLEYRGAAFVGFEKDSGEYISPLFHVLPDAEE